VSATSAKVAVLASGRGSNLAALLKARERGELPVEFVLVGSDRADALALQLADKAGIATLALDPKAYPDRQAFDMELFRRIEASGAHWLVLAGFMRIIDGEALRPWIGRMINIHPSLLPKYRGLHTHRRALKAGDTEHGASVHFVTAELDGGPVVAQARIAIRPGDGEQQLAHRLLPLEHRLLPAVLDLLTSGQLEWRDEAAWFHGKFLSRPLQMDERGFLRSE
jgi:phosphoribosylglycinamide formyltransferase-1